MLSFSKQGDSEDSEQEVPSSDCGESAEADGTVGRPTGRVSGAEAEDVVPVLARRAESLDGRMESDHGTGHRLTGRIEVKTTVYGLRLCEQLV